MARLVLQSRRANGHVGGEWPRGLVETLARWEPTWRCSEWRRWHAERAGRSTWERTSTRREAARRTELIPIWASRAAEGRVPARWELAMLGKRWLLLVATGNVLWCVLLSRL